MRTFVLLEYKNTKVLGWSDSANAIVTQQMGRFLGGFLQHNAAIIFKQAAKVSETCPDILFFRLGQDVRIRFSRGQRSQVHGTFYQKDGEASFRLLGFLARALARYIQVEACLSMVCRS